MQSGDMRHLITFQVAGETADGIGGVSVAWADSFSAYAKVVGISATERLEYQRLTGKIPIRLMTYYDPDINEQLRIKYAPDGTDRYFTIRSIYDYNGKRRGLVIDATEDKDA